MKKIIIISLSVIGLLVLSAVIYDYAIYRYYVQKIRKEYQILLPEDDDDCESLYSKNGVYQGYESASCLSYPYEVYPDSFTLKGIPSKEFYHAYYVLKKRAPYSPFGKQIKNELDIALFEFNRKLSYNFFTETASLNVRLDNRSNNKTCPTTAAIEAGSGNIASIAYSFKDKLCLLDSISNEYRLAEEICLKQNNKEYLITDIYEYEEEILYRILHCRLWSDFIDFYEKETGKKAFECLCENRKRNPEYPKYKITHKVVNILTDFVPEQMHIVEMEGTKESIFVENYNYHNKPTPIFQKTDCTKLKKYKTYMFVLYKEDPAKNKNCKAIRKYFTNRGVENLIVNIYAKHHFDIYAE